jgi:hypothetical protein
MKCPLLQGKLTPVTTRYVRLNQQNNPGAARWCNEHDRLECVKIKKNRQQCHGPAIRGIDACKTHGGFRKEVLMAKGEARITAWSAIGEQGKGIDSGMAVLGMLQMTWLRAAAYGELLRRQAALEGLVADDLTETDEPGSSGLIGFKYGAAGKDGTIYAQSEEIRALVALEAQERDRVVKFAKTAHDMGISARLTSLAERWGDLVITRIMLVLEALNLTPEQEIKVPALIQAHLGQIEIGQIGSGDEKK